MHDIRITHFIIFYIPLCIICKILMVCHCHLFEEQKHLISCILYQGNIIIKTIKYEWHNKGALTTNIHHVSQNKLVLCTENIFSGKMCTIYTRYKKSVCIQYILLTVIDHILRYDQ